MRQLVWAIALYFQLMTTAIQEQFTLPIVPASYGLSSIKQHVNAINGIVTFEKRADGFFTEIKF